MRTGFVVPLLRFSVLRLRSRDFFSRSDLLVAPLRSSSSPGLFPAPRSLTLTRAILRTRTRAYVRALGDDNKTGRVSLRLLNCLSASHRVAPAMPRPQDPSVANRSAAGY